MPNVDFTLTWQERNCKDQISLPAMIAKPSMIAIRVILIDNHMLWSDIRKTVPRFLI